MSKVYVTGMGAITSLGHSPEDMFERLKRGESGVREIPEWRKMQGLNSFLGAPAGDYDVSKIPRQVRRSMSRMSEMGALATFQALAHADLQPGPALNSKRVLLLIGSTLGSSIMLEAYFKKMFEKNGPEGQLSTSFFKIMSHTVAANVAASLEYDGALISPNSACTTSTQAMIMGWEMIRSGLYDVVIAGGADELHSISITTFDVVQASSRNNDHPDRTPRPFDVARDGTVVSEGAGVVILESEKSVRERGARPLAELAGGAYWCDSSHMSQSSTAAIGRVMSETLKRADLQPKDVDYINAHATGTIHGDAEEAKALADMFGPKMKVSSLKGHLGHSFAACGAVEAIACVKMMETGLLLPTRNLENIAPDCGGIDHVREITPARSIHVLSNNFAFGGMNTSLLLSAL